MWFEIAAPGQDVLTNIAYIILDWNCHTYICLSSIMFCLLAWSVACRLSQLDDQLKNLKGSDVRVVGVGHSLVCQAVWQLEEYFQITMLLTTGCIFVGIINNCFYSYTSFDEDNYIRAAVHLFQVAVKFVLLDAICYSAERLKDQVD